MGLMWDVEIRYKFPMDMFLQLTGDVIASSAQERLYDADGIEPLHMSVPADLKWKPKKDKKRSMMGRGAWTTRKGINRAEIKQKMLEKRGLDAKPLIDSGELVRSIHVTSLTDDKVTIGSWTDYAAIHQFGGTSTISQSKIDDWEREFGVKFTGKRTVNVFPRRFVRYEEKEQKLVMDTIRTIINRENKKNAATK
jgi:phage gpG-like protein